MNDNELKIEVSDCLRPESIFKKVPASELRLDDDFLKYEPETKAEKAFKKLVKKAIKKGLKDFWRPVYDPCFNEDNTGICYVSGKESARCREYNWWVKKAKDFCPELGSRIGTKSEYVAFLAVLIKELVASGKSLEWAWEAVCLNSKELGHYWNSDNSKHNFEDTGSREVCGFYDLANTCKLLAEDKDAGGHWLAGGCCVDRGSEKPLAGLYHFDDPDDSHGGSCGWLVLDSCPEC